MRSAGASVVSVEHKTFLHFMVQCLKKVSCRNWYTLYSKMFEMLLVIDQAIWFPIATILSVFSEFGVVFVEDYLIGAFSDYVYIERVFLNRHVSARIVRIFLILFSMNKPDFIVYVDVDYDESVKRQMLRSDSNLEHDSYLRFQYRFLGTLAKALSNMFQIKLLTIDTTSLGVAEATRKVIGCLDKS